MFLVVFTMLFNGGLIPTYYTYTQIFHIKNTYLAYIVPNLLMSAFNVILMKNYYTNNIPASLLESARIDGCGEFRIFAKIVFPLSLPITATGGITPLTWKATALPAGLAIDATTGVIAGSP